MNLHPTTVPAPAEYAAAFAAERAREYPEVDAYEHVCGFAVDRQRLEAAARVLACPVKAHPPNWQHGRVLYAAMRRYLATHTEYTLCFDCGTAKGFSALVAQWALNDAGVLGCVHSVDVINPRDRVFRNSVQDGDGPQRLEDYLTPWPEATTIQFYKMTGIEWLSADSERVNVAFLDGKHAADVVAMEGTLLSHRQDRGDLVLFDDVQIPGVAKAVRWLEKFYRMTAIALSAADRAYAIGVRL